MAKDLNKNALEELNKKVDVLLKKFDEQKGIINGYIESCLLYTSPSPRDKRQSRMPSSA